MPSVFFRNDQWFASLEGYAIRMFLNGPHPILCLEHYIHVEHEILCELPFIQWFFADCNEVDFFINPYQAFQFRHKFPGFDSFVRTNGRIVCIWVKVKLVFPVLAFSWTLARTITHLVLKCSYKANITILKVLYILYNICSNWNVDDKFILKCRLCLSRLYYIIYYFRINVYC